MKIRVYNKSLDEHSSNGKTIINKIITLMTNGKTNRYNNNVKVELSSLQGPYNYDLSSTLLSKRVGENNNVQQLPSTNAEKKQQEGQPWGSFWQDRVINNFCNNTYKDDFRQSAIEVINLAKSCGLELTATQIEDALSVQSDPVKALELILDNEEHSNQVAFAERFR